MDGFDEFLTFWIRGGSSDDPIPGDSLKMLVRFVACCDGGFDAYADVTIFFLTCSVTWGRVTGGSIWAKVLLSGSVFDAESIHKQSFFEVQQVGVGDFLQVSVPKDGYQGFVIH